LPPDKKTMIAFLDLRPAFKNRSAVGYMLGYAAIAGNYLDSVLGWWLFFFSA